MHRLLMLVLKEADLPEHRTSSFFDGRAAHSPHVFVQRVHGEVPYTVPDAEGEEVDIAGDVRPDLRGLVLGESTHKSPG
ncbi:hypothetical protein MTO96_006727 [Rhipicephalus appendiculatus]